MGPDQIRKTMNKQPVQALKHDELVKQTNNFPAPPVTLQAEKQQEKTMTQQEQDALTAWALQQDGHVAIPTVQIHVGVQEKKKFLSKTPTVTNIYKTESFQETRAKALQKKIPSLYASEKNDELLKAASDEVNLTLHDSLATATAPELVLLRKLNQAQNSPDSADVNGFQAELTRMGLPSSLEGTPEGHTFTDKETLVLMTASLCSHLQSRTDKAFTQGKEFTSAKNAINSLAMVTNSYANILVGKAYAYQNRLRRQAAERQRLEAERQRLEAERQRLELERVAEETRLANEEKERLRLAQEEASQKALRAAEYRRNNTALLESFLNQYAKSNLSMKDDTRFATLKSQLLTLMEGQMETMLVKGEQSHEDFMQALQQFLPQCAMYQTVTQGEATAEKLLNDANIQPGFHYILRNNENFWNAILNGDKTAALTYIQQLSNTIQATKNSAMLHLASIAPSMTSVAHAALVDKLARDMPSLFLSEGDARLVRQLTMMTRYHHLHLPAQTSSPQLKQAPGIPIPKEPLIAETTATILKPLSKTDPFYNFVPGENQEQFVQEEILLHLVRQKMKESHDLSFLSKEAQEQHHRDVALRKNNISANSITTFTEIHGHDLHKEARTAQEDHTIDVQQQAMERADSEVLIQRHRETCLALGRDILKEMSSIDQQELIKNLQTRANVPRLAEFLRQESPQLRQKIFGDILDGKSMAEIYLHASQLRQELSQTQNFNELEQPLRLLSFQKTDNSTAITDYRETEFSSLTRSTKHHLRSVARIERMQKDIDKILENVPPPHFALRDARQVILDTLTADKLNHTNIGEYTDRLKGIVEGTQANFTLTSAYLNEFRQKRLLSTGYGAALRDNLPAEMVRLSTEDYKALLDSLRTKLSNGETRAKLEKMQELQNRRFAAIHIQHPEIKLEDKVKIFQAKETMEAACGFDDGPWAEYITQKLSAVSKVLNIIDTRYNLASDLPDQLRLCFHKDIYETTLTETVAIKQFSAYYEAITKLQIQCGSKKLSISNSINTLLTDQYEAQKKKQEALEKKAKKADAVQIKSPEMIALENEYKVLSDYFTHFLSDCTVAESLEIERIWKDRKDSITTQVLANYKILSSFMEKQNTSGSPSEQDRLLAGFKMFTRQGICTMSPTDFGNSIQTLWEQFQHKDSVTQALTKAAQDVMSQRMTVLRDVDKHRNASVAMVERDETRQKELYDLQIGQRSVFHSVMGKPNADWDDDTVKTVAKAMKKRANKKAPPSDLASGLVAEYLSCRPDYKELIKDEEKLQLANSQAILLEAGIRAAYEKVKLPINDETVGKTMILALSFMAQGQVSALWDTMNDSLFETVTTAYLKRNSMLEAAAKTIYNTTVMERLGLDSLTMSEAQLATQIQATQCTTANLKLARTEAKRLFQEKTKALKGKTSNLWNNDTQDALINSWVVYRYKEFQEYGSKHEETLKQLAASDFANEELMSMLITTSNRDLHKNYLAQGVMGSINHTSLSTEEQANSITAVTNRDGFESWLVNHAKKRQVETFNSLSMEERQLFAFSLATPATMLGLEATMAGNLVKKAVPDLGGEVAVQAIQSFVLSGSLAAVAQTDYQKSVISLMATKSIFGIRNKVFDKAVSFAKYCIHLRKQALPVDTTLLTDARASIAAAQKPMAEPACTTAVELRGYLLKDKKALPNKLAKSLEGYQEDQLVLLVNLLQNRTLLDHSTVKGNEDYVSQDQRDDLIENYADNLPNALMAQTDNLQTTQKAYLALHSYQVQDGIEIKDTLSKTHFKEGALQRKTAVDVELLQEAVNLVDEIYKKGLRIQSMRNAPNLIEQSKNKLAKTAYNDFKDILQTQGEFDAFIQIQVQNQVKEHGSGSSVGDDSSKILGLLAAYQGLSKEEKRLFCKAVANRDVLDISKKHIMANRFGYKDRDFANRVGRQHLLDEYTESSDVVVEENYVQQALAGLLSTQVNDAADGEEMATTEGGVVKEQTSSRDTAVDWKLFQRAIQLVRRAKNEKKTREGHFELYVSTGTTHKEGQFRFESDSLRRNIHNAGNRVSRYIGRRIADRTINHIAGDSGDWVSDNISNLLGEKIGGYLEDSLSLEETEEVSEVNMKSLTDVQRQNHMQDFTGMFDQSKSDFWDNSGLTLAALGDVQTLADSNLLGAASSTVSSILSESTLNVASVVLETAEKVSTIVDAGNNLSTLKESAETFEANKAADAELQKQAEATQTKSQKERFQEAKEALYVDLSQSSELSKERQVDAIVDSVGEIVENVLGSDLLDAAYMVKLAGILINEAAKLINFARSAYHETQMVNEQLQADKLWAEKKAGALKDVTQIGSRSVNADEFAMAYSGYENKTEFASARGLDFVQSLLFSASRFNNLKGPKMLAQTVLSVLGLEQVGDNYSTRNAKVVFDKLMGSNR